MRVCFVAGTLGRGGAERQLVYMLRALTGLGIDVRVLSLTQGEPVEQEIRALGVPIEWVGSYSNRLLRLYKIINSLRRQPADIIQSSHFYGNMYVSLAARVMKIHDIGASRSNVANELQANGFMGHAQLSLPRHIIANSSLACTRIIKRGRSLEHIDLVRNAVDMQWLCTRPHPPENEKARILFVGRLTQAKRPDRFLRMLSKLRTQLPDGSWDARIVGDGPLRPQLEALAGALNLGPNSLEFLGERKDMACIYREADVLVLTSDWEGTPNVLLEAMACGIPVVATRVGGVAEIVDDSWGFVFDREDEEGLTAALRKLIANADLRVEMGTQGREYVQQFHSLEALQVRLLSIYEKVLAR